MAVADNELVVFQKFGRFKRAFSKTFKQFCEISSIHGIKYFHDSESNRFGKVLWMVIVVIMFICAHAMVVVFYDEFSSNPIRMNIESDHTPLSNLMFPAVTICPPTLYNLPQARKAFEKLTIPKNLSLDEVLNALDQTYVVIGGKSRVVDKNKLAILQAVADANKLTTGDVFKLISWNCSELMYRCRFRLKVVNCSDIFILARAHAGYCCSFNINGDGAKFLKYRALMFGPEGGLSVILRDAKTNQGRLDQFSSLEYELIVHQNNDFPHRTMASNSIVMNREIFAVVQPTEITCSDEFKALSIEDRQCLMPEEHNMRYFQVYNSDNCEFECRVIKTYDACNCVHFLYKTKDSKTKVCDFSTVPCLYNTYNYLGNDDEDKTTDRNKTIETSSPCYCPNSCQSVEYDVTITWAQLQTKVESSDPFYHGIRENNTVLHIFMHSQVYRRLRRDTLSNIITLFGNLGSAFGLFVGMSIISLLEILYFFTLVLLQNYVRQA